MMDIEKFEFIKKIFGYCASWAIWREQGNHPRQTKKDERKTKIED